MGNPAPVLSKAGGIHPTSHCVHLAPALQAVKSLPLGGTAQSLASTGGNR